VVKIAGDWQARFNTARAAIAELLERRNAA